MTPRTLRRWIAFLGSFGVYLIPLVGPHASWFLGEALIEELGGSRPAAWLVVDLAVAGFAQFAAWLVLRWSLDGAHIRKLAWLSAIPLAIGLNVAYLAVIPGYFLIEPDTAPETSTWAEHCFVRGVSLMSIRTGVDVAGSGASAWWTQRPDSGYALLRVPDCSLTDAVLPKPTVQPGGRVDFLIGLQFATPTGSAIVERTDTSTSQRSWSVLDEPTASLRTLIASAGIHGAPILSRSGDAVAWMEPVSGSGPPILERVLIRRAGSAPGFADVDVELAPFGPASYTLLDLDTAARELTLWRTDRPLVVGFDGQERPSSFEAGHTGMPPSGHDIPPSDERLGGVGRLSGRGPYQVAWSIGSRSGTHRTNAGRSITSAAVDPTGTFSRSARRPPCRLATHATSSTWSERTRAPRCFEDTCPAIREARSYSSRVDSSAIPTSKARTC